MHVRSGRSLAPEAMWLLVTANLRGPGCALCTYTMGLVSRRSEGAVPVETSRRTHRADGHVSPEGTKNMRRLLWLLFLAAVVLFVGNYEATLVPYWGDRLPASLALVEDHDYREALTNLLESPESWPPGPPQRGARPRSIDEAVARGRDARTLDIDLLAATLDARPFFDYSLDEITEMLGPPTWIQAPRVVVRGSKRRLDGAHVKYHWSGLDFRFRHPELDPGQSCCEIGIRTADVWDGDALLRYKPFPGTIAQGVGGEWSADRVFREVLLPTPESGDVALKGFPSDHVMILRHHTAEFTYERDTSLLQTVRLIHSKPETGVQE